MIIARLIAAGTLLLAPDIAFAQPAPDPVGGQRPTVTRHGDWTAQCIVLDEGARRQCIAFQSISLPGLPAEGGPTLSLRIGRPGGANVPPVLEVVLPLGVALPPGVALAIDGETGAQAPYARCTQQGCSALFPLMGDLDASLRAGRRATLGFQDGAGDPFAVPISLIGYTGARRAVAPANSSGG